jgi:hypothetical protein
MIPVIPKINFSPHATRLTNFAALCAWLIASIFMAISSFIWYGEDFKVYYAAARLLLTGGNPYDYGQLFPILFDLSGRIGNTPYFYPPWFAWFIMPLGWLPFEIARGIWMLFNLVIWIVGLCQLTKLFDWPDTGWRRWLMFLYATFLFAWVNWRYEQIGILLFTLSVYLLWAIRKRRWGWAGLCLALLLIKPNITLVFVMTVGLWLIRRGQWQPIRNMYVILVGLFIVSIAITPGWYRSFLQPGFESGLVNILSGSGRSVAVRINTTMIDWLPSVGIKGYWQATIYLFATIISGLSLLLAVFRLNSLIKIVVLSLIVSFIVTPYALQYDFPLLTLPLFWTTSLILQSRQAFWGGLIISAFNLSVLIWEHPISDGYWIVIGLVILTIWSWVHTNWQSIPENLLLEEI